MSKILITSLGTGPNNNGEYRTAKYKIDDKIYEEKLIAKALSKHIQFDEIFIVGTKKSMWDSVYGEFGGIDNDTRFDLLEKQENNSLIMEDLDIVSKTIENFLGKEGSKLFLIDYGLNNTELWNNFGVFMQIATAVSDGDEIYLDITHSFRSLSLMSYVMLDFIKAINRKQFTVKAIYYAMFEYIHEPENKEKIAPIVDISIIFQISEWIQAISAFHNFGRADLITDQFAKSFGEKHVVTKKFNSFSQNISIGNMAAIQKYINSITDKMFQQYFKSSPILEIISKDLMAFIERMRSDKLSDFQIKLSEWFNENKNYALSYIVLSESIITKICELENLSAIGMENREKAKNNLRSMKRYRALKNLQITPNRIRNNIAHQLPNRKNSVINDIANLKKSINNIKREFKNLDNI